MEFIHQSRLPFVGMSYEFSGAEHGGIGASFFLVISKPGCGPRLHKHTYDKIVYVISGRAKWIVGDEVRNVMAGDILVVRAGEPHKFVSDHDDPVRQIDVHLNPTFEMEWME
jgi:quercetin dioxygenase-like cupin family protein